MATVTRRLQQQQRHRDRQRRQTPVRVRGRHVTGGRGQVAAGSDVARQGDAARPRRRRLVPGLQCRLVAARRVAAELGTRAGRLVAASRQQRVDFYARDTRTHRYSDSQNKAIAAKRGPGRGHGHS